MKKALVIFIVLVFTFAAGIVVAPMLTRAQQNMMTDEQAHPRLAAAITNLQDAIAYLQAAPHNFGGHKVMAIAACQNAVKQLKMAMKYREKMDNKKGGM